MRCIFHKWETKLISSNGERIEVCKKCGKTRVVQVYDIVGKVQIKKGTDNSMEVTHKMNSKKQYKGED